VTDCPLCAALAAGAAVVANHHAAVIPDAFPLSPGHHLVLCRRHEPDYFALTSEEVDAVWELVAETQKLVVGRWHPDGFNVGVNVGEAAGQTIGHMHVHVIPRYRGDMPDPRGGIRWVLPDRAPYWHDTGERGTPSP
jgi:diadenosine tetraphosphate (Ap4A) HIT family hydrolase